MTDKERLEEVKQRLVLLHNATNVGNGTKNFIFNCLKVEWLIEQTKKNITCQEVLELQKDALKGLLKQNKRYREAIEFGIEYLKNSDIRQVQLVVTALKSALEDSK